MGWPVGPSPHVELSPGDPVSRVPKIPWQTGGREVDRASRGAELAGRSWRGPSSRPGLGNTYPGHWGHLADIDGPFIIWEPLFAILWLWIGLPPWRVLCARDLVPRWWDWPGVPHSWAGPEPRCH